MKPTPAPEGYIIGLISGQMEDPEGPLSPQDDFNMRHFVYVKPDGSAYPLPYEEWMTFFPQKMSILEMIARFPEDWREKANESFRILRQANESLTDPHGILESLLRTRIRFMLMLDSWGGDATVYAFLSNWAMYIQSGGGEVECYGRNRVGSAAFRTWMLGDVRHANGNTRFLSHFSSVIRDALDQIQEGVNVDENKKTLAKLLPLERRWLLWIWEQIREDHPRRDEILTAIQESRGDLELKFTAHEMKDLGLLNGEIFANDEDSRKHFIGRTPLEGSKTNA